jgi:tetratricopeptide (TPR) repeat protein
LANEPTEVAAPAARPPASQRALLLVALALFATCALVYAGELGGPFVFDDDQAIVDNPTVRSPLALAVLSPPRESPVAGRPLANLSIAIDRARAGLAPHAFHATNLLLHFLVALLAYATLRRTLRTPRMPARIRERASGLALGTALLFSVHPMTVELVLYATQRTESLVAIAYLGALYVLLRASERNTTGLTVSMAVLALAGVASKEVFVTAPVVVLFFDRAFLSGSFAAAWRERRALHLVLAGSWLPLIWLQKGDTRPGSVRLGELDYLLAQAKIIPEYIATALVPAHPVFDYGPLLPASVVHAWPWVCALAVVVLLSSVLAFTHPRLGFFGVWIFGILAPTSSLLSIHTEVGAERRFYLPLIALLAGVVLTVDALLEHGARPLALSARGLDRLCQTALLLTALLLAVRARAYADCFTDPRRLWDYAASVRPENPRVHYHHYNVAEALRRKGDLRGAEAEYRLALAGNAAYPDAHQNLGGMLLQLGRTEEGLAEIERGVQATPKDLHARFNFAIALAIGGHMDAAARELAEIVRRDPGQVEARFKLAAALLALGRTAEVQAQLTWLEQRVPRDPRVQELIGAIGARSAKTE